MDPNPSKRILIVEDDRDTREALKIILAAAGHSVRLAANGREALDELGNGPSPDLILLDLMMPVLDGWHFLEQKKADPALAPIPVIIVSAAGDLPAKSASLGAVGLLQKPIEFGLLLDTVVGQEPTAKPGILVVDDEPQVRNLLGLALGHRGFTVWLAGGGAEAVEVYRQQRAAVNLVLLDVQMPGLDGPETLAALKAIDPDVRCCFMSGHTGRYTAEELLALGATSVFQKPFGLADITEALRHLLPPASHAAGAGARGP